MRSSTTRAWIMAGFAAATITGIVLHEPAPKQEKQDEPAQAEEIHPESERNAKTPPTQAPTPRWLGLEVAPGGSCSTYRAADYVNAATWEGALIVQGEEKIWSPYDGRCWPNPRQTERDLIVDPIEAHQSGFCDTQRSEERRHFASDESNRAIAERSLSARAKGVRDAAHWLPPKNRCWYARTVIEVKTRWRLSVDEAERNALQAVLETCGMNAQRLQSEEPIGAQEWPESTKTTIPHCARRYTVR